MRSTTAIHILITALSSSLILGCSSAHDGTSDDAQIATDTQTRADVSVADDAPASTLDTTVFEDGAANDAHDRDGDSGAFDTGPFSDASVSDSTAASDSATTDIGTDGRVLLAGEFCENATVLAAGVYAGQTTIGYSADYLYDRENGCVGLNGPERVYAVDVPAGIRLRASVVPGDNFDPSINLARGPCNVQDQACIVGDDSGAPSASNAATYFNGGTTSERIYIFVAGAISERVGDFLLTIQFMAPPTGDVCTAPFALVSGTLTNQTTIGFGDDFTSEGDGCARANGTDAVYSIDIPAGQVLRTRVTPTGEGRYDPTINIVAQPAANCSGNLACLAGSDSRTAGQPESLAYYNSGLTTRGVYVIVDGFFSSGEFTLSTELSAVAAGDRCATATTIATGTLAGQSTLNFSDDYNTGTGCRSSGGGDRVYAIDVPSAQRLTVTATPEATFDLSLSITTLDMCEGQRRCLDGADAQGDGDAETLTYTNVSAEARRIYIVVDGFNEDGAFALTTALAPL